MNIIREYSLDQVRKNRRTSISIMVAVLIASTFLCALLVFAQSFWNQMVQQEIYIGGDWDAELMDVPADRLGMVRDNAGVKAMFVKGDNQTAFRRLPARSWSARISFCRTRHMALVTRSPWK